MKGLLLIALSFYLFDASAQDERFYRKIFTGELFQKPQEIEEFKIVVKTPKYKLDLNRDGIEESIVIMKKDGIDFFTILDSFGRLIFEKRLSTMGKGSKLFKMQLKTLSKNTDALILHFYEGATEGTVFEATARLYFLTIDHRNLNKLYFYEGPHFYHEKQMPNGKYFNRRYTVNTLDYNDDGVKEISISYNKISRIFFYVSEGIWSTI